jgi:hypothetical protein
MEVFAAKFKEGLPTIMDLNFTKRPAEKLASPAS